MPFAVLIGMGWVSAVASSGPLIINEGDASESSRYLISQLDLAAVAALFVRLVFLSSVASVCSSCSYFWNCAENYFLYLFSDDAATGVRPTIASAPDTVGGWLWGLVGMRFLKRQCCCYNFLFLERSFL